MRFELLADSSVELKTSSVLLYLIVVILTARAAAAIARRLGQPAVVGEIIAGLILGPSLLGKLKFIHGYWSHLFQPEKYHAALSGLPDVFSVLSQLGLIFLLFLIGLEFDFTHLRRSRGASMLISVTGVLLPFIFGVGLAAWMFNHLSPPMESWKRLGFALFMGTAMSITAIPILGRIMMEMNISRTRLGAVTITAAAVDDACGWILLATVSAIVNSGFQLRGTLIMIGQTLAFAAVMVLLVRPLICKWARSVLRSGNGSLGLVSLAILISLLFICSIITSKIGIFAIFGAFLFGSILSGETEFRAAINNRLRDFVTAFFLPIFFTSTGLRTDIGTIHGPAMWAFAAAVSALAIIGKFGGCSLAAKVAGFSTRESVLIGVMMNTRALMELIVIRAGLDLGVIPPSVFCMLVMMAVLTTIMTSPLMLRMIPGTELEPLVRASGFYAGRCEATESRAFPSRLRPGLVSDDLANVERSPNPARISTDSRALKQFHSQTTTRASRWKSTSNVINSAPWYIATTAIKRSIAPALKPPFGIFARAGRLRPTNCLASRASE